MLKVYYRNISEEKMSILETVQPGSWLHAVNPTNKEIKQLKSLGVSLSQIEDALDPEELPRLEKEGDNLYLIFNVPLEENNGNLLIAPLLVVLAKDYLITVSRHQFKFFDGFFQNPECHTTQKIKNLIFLAIQIVKSYDLIIRNVSKNINSRQINLLKLNNREIVKLVKLESTLNQFLTSLVTQIPVLEKILSGKYIEIFDEDKYLTEDLIIDSRQNLEMVRTAIRNIVDVREAYSTITSNNLNKVIKLLTSLTLIIGVPTLISSIFGMNVGLPLHNNPLGFLYILLIMFLISILLIIVFYFKDWL